jgi:hypothetical protein
MAPESAVAALSRQSRDSFGVFTVSQAAACGVSRKQLVTLARIGVIERVLPGTYRMTVVAPSSMQSLAAALLWSGTQSAAAGRSAGEVFNLEGVRANQPEIVVPRSIRARAEGVVIHRPRDGQMIRRYRGFRVTGVEATLAALAHQLESEALEIACEDARRRRLTSIPALNAYLQRYGTPGRPGIKPLRALLKELDPVWASRSTLEVKTRRLLVARGITGFTREFPLAWNGVTYHFDFAFAPRRTILETNGRRWHDDATDYEFDNNKWSVPGRHGFRIVLATWEKVTRHPDALIHELTATLAA